ncbi:MAG: hypothetical protein PVF33_10360 [Candidatus Latescibacterota bacterium]
MKRVKLSKKQLILRLAATVILAASLTACNLFQPREAENPGGDDDRVAFRPANSAAGVFPNLKSGVENLAQGENYDRSLADDFVFLPLDEDAIDPSLPAGIYENWTKEVELNVLKLMISESSAASVTFSPSPQINENDFVQFRVTYVLKLTSKSDASESEIQGVAEMDVRRISGIWLVERWKDIERVESYTTWGYLKGTLRAQLGG